jgi:hypothetical protein
LYAAHSSLREQLEEELLSPHQLHHELLEVLVPQSALRLILVTKPVVGVGGGWLIMAKIALVLHESPWFYQVLPSVTEYYQVTR